MSGPSLVAQESAANFTCNDLHQSIRFYTEGLGFMLTVSSLMAP